MSNNNTIDTGRDHAEQIFGILIKGPVGMDETYELDMILSNMDSDNKPIAATVTALLDMINDIDDGETVLERLNKYISDGNRTFRFEELSDEAKAQALANSRLPVPDLTTVVNGVVGILEEFGIQNVRIASDYSRDIYEYFHAPIYELGNFDSSFTSVVVGRYQFKPDTDSQCIIQSPDAPDLLVTARELYAIQQRYDFKVCADMDLHKDLIFTLKPKITVFHADGAPIDTDDSAIVEKALRSLMICVHKKLQAEYRFQVSNESTELRVKSNNFEYTVTGELI